MSARRLGNALHTIFRVAAISLGGYGLVSALCILAGLALHELGIALSEAMLTTVLSGYIGYVALVMWGFAEQSGARRAWIILVSAAATMSLATLAAPAALG